MISFEMEGGKFNFRVGGIIYNHDKTKVLVNRIVSHDFWCVPGGRVEMLEDTKTGLKREIVEEVGYESEIVGLKAVLENIFNAFNQDCHEIGYYYEARILDDKKGEEFIENIFSKEGEFCGIEGEKHRYQWVPVSSIGDEINLLPRCIGEIIKNPEGSIQHIVNKDI